MTHAYAAKVSWREGSELRRPIVLRAMLVADVANWEVVNLSF